MGDSSESDDVERVAATSSLSHDLQPGQALRHVESGTVVVLDRRKTSTESRLPGWWLRDGMWGLADAVIDGGSWVVVEASDG